MRKLNEGAQHPIGTLCLLWLQLNRPWFANVSARPQVGPQVGESALIHLLAYMAAPSENKLFTRNHMLSENAGSDQHRVRHTLGLDTIVPGLRGA